MSRKVRSMRGEVVDFDLFAIKAVLNGAAPTENIENRERYINLKRKRGTKRKLQDMLAEQDESVQRVNEALATKAATPVVTPVAEAVEEEETAVETPTRRIKKDN